MIKIPAKLTTEELADFVGMTKQTVNRWIRKKGWQTQKIPGVKGGRGRQILIDKNVLAFIEQLPKFRHLTSGRSLAEPAAAYGNLSAPMRQIISVLQTMTPSEEEQLDRLLKRNGLQYMLSRLDITETSTHNK
ncbi:YfeC-like transcriptional regulator [Enterobacter sp. ENT03]|uniref:YfeC-like transcriptional regulator n=1 Tax=Enterobacter sp. ENT03 TaxID=2854780 RepID=UPI001C440900|nr:YfeC-like transcriptional regulator [Enterobacter sp. ENT03]MBV7404036.1 putative DNA-binding transcriptional regulator [Enterobacter sp. ENT03]